MATATKQTLSSDVTLESFELIQRVRLTLYAELDQRKVSVRELLDLRPGSVLSLTRPAGENISLYAADVLLGSGEVLVVDTKLAVRIAELRDQPADPLGEQQTSSDAE